MVSILLNSAFVPVSEAVFWIATGEQKTGEQLHNELWRLLRDRLGLRISSSEHGFTDPLGDAARDVFWAHCSGAITIKGQEGQRALTRLPRDVVAHEAAFNPFTNCVVSESAKVAVWRNLQVRTSEIEAVFAIRAETARSYRARTPGSEGDCERWLVGLMEGGQPKSQSKSSLQSQAEERFGIGAHAFDRAWKRAVAKTASGWDSPGAPRKPKL